MNHSFTIPVAAVGTAKQLQDQFQIAGIVIDNPSGSWLYLPDVQKFIPPLTLGWRVNIAPTRQQVMLRFVAAPSGGKVSTLTGDPVIATIYDEEVIDVTGLDFGLLPAIQQLTVDITGLSAQIVLLIDAIDNLRTGNGAASQADFQTTFLAHTMNAGTFTYTDVVFIPAPGAGLRTYITRLCVIGNFAVSTNEYEGMMAASVFARLLALPAADTIIEVNPTLPDVRANAGAIFGSVNGALQLSVNVPEFWTMTGDIQALVEWYVAP